MIVVFIPGVQDKIMLENKGSEPHVICWNRCPLLSELAEDVGVVMRRLIIGKDDTDSFFMKELSEDSLIVCFPTAMGESGSQLAEHDERQEYCVGFLEK
jgi:hypothetical protein